MGINEIVQIGNKIRKLRMEKGFSQKEMATLTGIPYSTYSNYENNNREPNIDNLQKIADVLNVTLDDLIGTIPLTALEYAISLLGPYTTISAFKNARTQIIDTALSDPILDQLLLQHSSRRELTKEEKEAIASYIYSDQFKAVRKQIKQPLNESIGYFGRIQHAYKKLNASGQEKIAEHAEMIAKIPEYQRKPDEPATYVNAAHADNYANAPEELKQQEEQIMDNKDF